MEGYKDNSGFNAVFGSSGSGGVTPSSQAYFSGISVLGQTCGLPLSVVDVTPEVTLLSQDITAGTDGTLTYNLGGLYALNFSLQMIRRTGGGSGENFWVWLLLNGFNVSNSATSYVVNSNLRYNVASLDFLLQLNAGDQVKIVWTTDNSDIELLFESAPTGRPYPDIPSVIVNSWKIN